MSAIYVEITATRGSAPRDAGTTMMVTADRIEGTIGGGALEYRAIATARDMLLRGQTDRRETIPLGPDLGQCCGGAVSLHFTGQTRAVDTPCIRPMIANIDHPVPVWLWGAGHVGRAIVQSCSPRAFRVTWIDSDASRFPDWAHPHAEMLPAADMPRLAANAPPNVHHLILTFSHEIDLTLCAALLQRPTASIGLIGSKTKRARFFKRLTGMGLDPSLIICPIGDKSLGKEPVQIAQGVVKAVTEMAQEKKSA